MAAKKSASLDFTRKYLRKKPEATFAEIRDAAEEAGLKIYPIVFGRAKALEGLVKVAPYGSKKRAREAAAESRASGAAPVLHLPRERGMERPGERQGKGPGIESIEAVIAGMRENHLDRERYRSALIRISEILDEVL